MENLSTIFIGIWVALILTVFFRNLLDRLYFSNFKTNKKWLRKRLANKAVKNMAYGIRCSNNYKAEKLAAEYTAKSAAIKAVYINDGYLKAEIAIIAIIEKYERFVAKYKYNTFDNISSDDEDQIRYLDKLINPKN
jgi:hypothetical protein